MLRSITAARITTADGIEKTGQYALLLAQRGTAALFLGDTELALRAGTLCLLCPGDAPECTAAEHFSGVLIRIPAELAAVPVLSPLFSHFANGARVEMLDLEKTAFFDTVMGGILQIEEDTPFAAQQMLARVIDLLAVLPVPMLPVENGTRGRITDAVLGYIEAHISQAISLDDIAAALFISKYHMSHVFKAENGISVGEAVLRRKVAHAEMLLASGVPAHRVSEMVGFNHYSAFFRIFKRITGCAPTGK